jgi:hypothetical protein
MAAKYKAKIETPSGLPPALRHGSFERAVTEVFLQDW